MNDEKTVDKKVCVLCLNGDNWCPSDLICGFCNESKESRRSKGLELRPIISLLRVKYE